MEYVNDLPWSFVSELQKYWRSNPPLHILKRAELGYEPKNLDLDDVPFFGEDRPAKVVTPAIAGAPPLRTAPRYIQDLVSQYKEGKLPPNGR